MFFDHSDGDLLCPLSDSLAMDSDGDLMLRMSGSVAMDLDSGEMHMTSNWAPSDCCFDDEDPYNPCGPHHGVPNR